MEHSTSTTGESARGVIDRVRDSASAQIASQKNRATDSLGSFAQAVRKTSQPLRDSQQQTIAEYVDKAADQIERFSTRLRERDVKEIVDDVQQFARRKPAVFIGAALAVGVLAARFLKSTRDSRPYAGGGY